MDINKISTAIKRVIKDHFEAFKQIGSNQPKLLEFAAFAGLAQHYKSKGFKLSIVNPRRDKGFKVKTSTRGYPWNFSRIILAKHSEIVELHMNLLVRSAHDEGIYCVDVGVVKGKCIPEKKEVPLWECLENKDLITFAEAKKLVIYPMLLAQFIGIVHEIMPKFINHKKPDTAHLPPILIAVGHLSGNSSTIINNYPKRNIRIVIAENYDIRLARLRGGTIDSPFDDQETSGS